MLRFFWPFVWEAANQGDVGQERHHYRSVIHQHRPPPSNHLDLYYRREHLISWLQLWTWTWTPHMWRRPSFLPSLWLFISLHHLCVDLDPSYVTEWLFISLPHCSNHHLSSISIMQLPGKFQANKVKEGICKSSNFQTIHCKYSTHFLDRIFTFGEIWWFQYKEVQGHIMR